MSGGFPVTTFMSQFLIFLHSCLKYSLLFPATISHGLVQMERESSQRLTSHQVSCTFTDLVRKYNANSLQFTQVRLIGSDHIRCQCTLPLNKKYISSFRYLKLYTSPNLNYTPYSKMYTPTLCETIYPLHITLPILILVIPYHVKP